MRVEIRRGYVAAATITLAIALLALNMIGPVISSTADFSIFNTGWNGTSQFARTTYESGKLSPTFELQYTGADLTVVKLGLDEIALDPFSGALIIIGPDVEFSEDEGRIVRDFVMAGGRLMLADDFGTANSLLAAMGAGSRFSNRLVMDLAFDKKPEFSVCFDFEADAITRNITTILLNYPSSVVPSATNTEVVAWTSVASWQDTNGDHDYSFGEPWGPFPLIVRERMGDGEIVLLADPSLLINGMRDRLDNAMLADNLISAVSELRTAVYFDESHRQYFDPVTITTSFTGSISTLQKVMLLVLALALLIWLSTDYVDRGVRWFLRRSKTLIMSIYWMLTGKKIVEEKPPEIDIERIVRELIDEHPDWKHGLLRYALREKIRHSRFLAEERPEE